MRPRAAPASPACPIRRVVSACVVAAAVAIAVRPARADSRLDGTLRLFAAHALEGRALGASARSGGRVAVSVRVAGGASALHALGFAGARAAGPRTAFLEVRPEELARLEASPAVVRVSRARALHPTLDRSTPIVNAPAARAAFSVDGSGVIVGLVDTGLDFRHDDFRDAQGHTRVAALLDLASPRAALHPELPDYGKGAVWLAADLDAQLAAEAQGMTPAVPVTEKDTSGHGTHVAGIAAGDGLATGGGLPAGRYVGLAPGATIVAAQTARAGASFGEEDILTSLTFVLDRAKAVGLPVAVNLSLGGDGGPHDGTENLERGIADLAPPTTPGVAVVVSAGNGGSRDLHAGGLVLQGSAVEVRIPFPTSAPANAVLSCDLWFDGPPPPITIVDPAGHPHGPAASGATFSDAVTATSGRVSIDDASAGPDAQDHRYEATFYVQASGDVPVAGGTWTLVLDGSGGAGDRAGRWDAWLTGVDPDATEPRFQDALDEDVRGDYPAFAESVISVGSFVSRDGWTTDKGEAIARGTIVPRPSSFSGTGPTRDGRFFPDLAAPGDFIISSLSEDAPASSPASVFHYPPDADYLVADDGVHGVLRGTSQAAPHVTGAIALLLARDPTLTAARIRELLRTAAATDRGAPGYSTKLGFGRLDVLRALELLDKAPHAAVDPLVSSVGVSRDAVLPKSVDATATVTVTPRDSSGMPLGAGRTVDIEGQVVAPASAPTAADFSGPVVDVGEGRYERTLRADGPIGSACAVTATVDGVALAASPTVWFVRSRADIGAPPAASGCALARGRRPMHAPALLASLVALAALTRSVSRARRGRASHGARVRRGSAA